MKGQIQPVTFRVECFRGDCPRVVVTGKTEPEFMVILKELGWRKNSLGIWACPECFNKIVEQECDSSESIE